MSVRIGSLNFVFNNPLENAILMVLLIVFTVLGYAFMVYFRGKRATFFGNIKTLERVHGFKRFYVSPALLIFKAFIIALLFLVATESVEIFKQQDIVDADYMILLDASSSMAQTDYEPNRLEAAKSVAIQWLGVLPEFTKIGFVAFTQDVQDSMRLGLDRTLLREKINSINIDYSKSGTSLDFALNFALSYFDNSTTNKTILLLTDNAEQVADTTIAAARSKNIKVFAFGIGGNQTQFDFDTSNIPEEFLDAYNQQNFNISALETLANLTGGKAFHVESADSLQDAFESATREEVEIRLNSGYYILLLIALMSIAEFFIFAKFGGL